jgi:hypothetical protein
VGRGGYATRYFGRALPDGAAIAYHFLTSLLAHMTLSAMMALLRNSGKVQPVLSNRCSVSLVDEPLMKLAFFLASISTCSGAYYAKWLNSLE